jgi:hypothetical protein
MFQNRSTGQPPIPQTHEGNFPAPITNNRPYSRHGCNQINYLIAEKGEKGDVPPVHLFSHDQRSTLGNLKKMYWWDIPFTTWEQARNRSKSCAYPFVYLGPAERITVESERPIKIVWMLRSPIPVEMYEPNRRGG